MVRYFPNINDYNVSSELYAEQLQQAKNVTDIPIIGSLNVTSVGDWLDYARDIEQAGADALELNVYYVPAQTRMTSVQV